jgi:uncharacterized membrane-anchored protein
VNEFFTTLPQAGAALWEFMDGFYGVVIFLGSVVLTAALLFVAKAWRDTHSWLSAIAGISAASVAFWWAFGILPSAFTYFMDSERDLLEGTLVPGALPAMDNFYQVFRDVVVVGMQTVFVVVFAIIMLRIQRRYPRSLAEGEEKSPATGGYR